MQILPLDNKYGWLMRSVNKPAEERKSCCTSNIISTHDVLVHPFASSLHEKNFIIWCSIEYSVPTSGGNPVYFGARFRNLEILVKVVSHL
jgi:hypothetical protein